MSFYPTIFAWARRFGVPFHDAHDVTMEVVIRAAERWDAFELRADEHPRAARRVWLFVFTYRAAAAWRRSAAHARVEPRDPADMDAFAGQGEHHRSPEQAALDHESERTAGAALAALRPETSAENWRVLLAHEVQGVPVKALATLEGVSPSIIYYRLCSARRDLRAAIQRLRARVAFEQTSAKRRRSR